MAGKVVMKQIFPTVFEVSPSYIIPPVLHIDIYLIWNRLYVWLVWQLTASLDQISGKH